MKSIKLRTKEYNTSDYLKTPKDIAAYLNEVLKGDDQKLLILALRNVADSQSGIATNAEHMGLNCENLYKTLSGKLNPRIEIINSIPHTYDSRLTVTVN